MGSVANVGFHVGQVNTFNFEEANNTITPPTGYIYGATVPFIDTIDILPNSSYGATAHINMSGLLCDGYNIIRGVGQSIANGDNTIFCIC